MHNQKVEDFQKKVIQLEEMTNEFTIRPEPSAKGISLNGSFGFYDSENNVSCDAIIHFNVIKQNVVQAVNAAHKLVQYMNSGKVLTSQKNDESHKWSTAPKEIGWHWFHGEAIDRDTRSKCLETGVLYVIDWENDVFGTQDYEEIEYVGKWLGPISSPFNGDDY